MRPFAGVKLAIKIAILLSVMICPVMYGQDCQTSANLPDGLTKLGGGTATKDYDGNTQANGNQTVYVKIKNVNLLGVAYTLKIAQNSQPPVTICTYKAILLPTTNVILSGALFADPPVSWKITVTIGDESDAGTLTYEVFSQPQ